MCSPRILHNIIFTYFMTQLQCYIITKLKYISFYYCNVKPVLPLTVAKVDDNAKDTLFIPLSHRNNYKK